jgi:hypothetical protein
MLYGRLGFFLAKFGLWFAYIYFSTRKQASLGKCNLNLSEKPLIVTVGRVTIVKPEQNKLAPVYKIEATQPY